MPKSSFGFTNKTQGTAVPTTAIAPVTNYGKIQDEPDEAILTNRTCPIDQGENVTYRNRNIKNISCQLPVLNPAKVQSGIEFGVRLDEILRTFDDVGNIICDEPIIASLSFKCFRSSNITDEVMDTVMDRLLGAWRDETNGKWRWGDVMRSALIPSEN